MFGFRWPFRRSTPRLIFRYTVAGRRRVDDPLRIDARMAAEGGIDWRKTVEDVAKHQKPMPPEMVATLGEDEIRRQRERFAESVAKLVKWSRAAFDLPELNRETGDGVTDGEAVDVLVAYLEFSESLWENARPFR